jgi:hypothetical protein
MASNMVSSTAPEGFVKEILYLLFSFALQKKLSVGVSPSWSGKAIYLSSKVLGKWMFLLIFYMQMI